MNTKLNLFKDKTTQLKLKNEEVTQERLLKQTKKCEDKFENWQTCIKMKSWNDEQCVGKLKPDYEYCISKRNLMQTILDNKFDEEF
jgi:hypothetical protein